MGARQGRAPRRSTRRRASEVTEFGKALSSTDTPIPGLVVWDLPVHGDSRGLVQGELAAREDDRRRAARLRAGAEQHLVQRRVGTTRGIHAEPWDKWVSVATGRIFGAWVDLREGPTFGTVFTAEIDPSRAIFVPRGVGNAYQTLEPDTAYTYLVNDHWSADAAYTFLNLADETAAIAWPIPLDEAEISEKDRAHPRLADVVPDGAAQDARHRGDGPARTRAARASSATRRGCRVRDALRSRSRRPAPCRRPPLARLRRRSSTRPPTPRSIGPRHRTGRRDAWAANVAGVSALAAVAAANGITLVHVSSDYVFDGAADRPYRRGRSASHRWACTGRPRPPAIRSSRPCRVTTSSAPRGSSATAATSSAPWRRSPSAASIPRSWPTRSAA